ncbi:MAG TPA: methyltransferase domain-containing protein [Polyangiaceae bacterium]
MDGRDVIDPLGAVPVDPHYVQGNRSDEFWAHFRSGAVVHASRDRTRHYPGLGGAAPATLGMYLLADDLPISANHVIDAGCGAGEGLRRLTSSHRRVTGVDRDPRALAFARQWAPDARVIQVDLGQGALRVEPAQLALAIDVIGHFEQPERALWALSQKLDTARGLLSAEVLAAADQCLTPPARRAFSPRGMHAMLIRSGFAVEQWLRAPLGFLSCYSVAHRDSAAVALLDAEHHFSRGALPNAETLVLEASKSSIAALRLEALLALARVQVELNRRDAATATLLEARKLDSGDARPLAALSRLAHLAGSASQAVSLARQAVQLDMTEVTAVAALGLAIYDDDPRAALDAWLVAHALAPDHSGIAAKVCEAAVQLEDYSLAITVLERLKRYVPLKDAARSSKVMAWLLAHEGKSLQAELQTRLAETLEPDSADIRELREFLKGVTAS